MAETKRKLVTGNAALSEHTLKLLGLFHPQRSQAVQLPSSFLSMPSGEATSSYGTREKLGTCQFLVATSREGRRKNNVAPFVPLKAPYNHFGINQKRWLMGSGYWRYKWIGSDFEGGNVTPSGPEHPILT